MVLMRMILSSNECINLEKRENEGLVKGRMLTRWGLCGKCVTHGGISRRDCYRRESKIRERFFKINVRWVLNVKNLMKISIYYDFLPTTWVLPHNKTVFISIVNVFRPISRKPPLRAVDIKEERNFDDIRSVIREGDIWHKLLRIQPLHWQRWFFSQPIRIERNV